MNAQTRQQPACEALRIREAAAQVGVDEHTIRRMIDAGRLPAARMGRVYRIRQADLDALFRRQVKA